MSSDLLRSSAGHWLVPANRADLLDGLPPRRERESVTVVVPYFAQPAQLARLLAALSLQTWPPDRLEVVIADDGSPQPVCCADQLTSGTPVRVVRQDDLGFRAGAARNLGARAGAGDLVVFLDADMVPEPDYLERLLLRVRLSPDVVAVGRRRHADLTGFSAPRVTAWLSHGGPAPDELAPPQWLADGYAHDLLDADDRSFRYVLSAVLACQRRLFDDLGGFDERFVGYGGEDWDFGYRAFNGGAVLVHERDAVAWHDGYDWAGRGGASGGAGKIAETLRLAALIPEPATRGAALPGELPDVLADLTGAGWTTASTAACVHSLLDQSHRDLAIRLPATSDLLLDAVYAAAGRVRRTDWNQDQLRRARARLTVHRPVTFDHDAVARLLAAVRAPRGGRVRVSDGSTVVATMTSTRAAGRARRWKDTASLDAVIASAFDDVALDASELTEPAPADLAAFFAHRGGRA